MDGVGGDGEDGSGREVVGCDCDAGARGDETWEAEGGGAVDAEGFAYYVVETVGRGLGQYLRKERTYQERRLV